MQLCAALSNRIHMHGDLRQIKEDFNIKLIHQYWTDKSSASLEKKELEAFVS